MKVVDKVGFHFENDGIVAQETPEAARPAITISVQNGGVLLKGRHGLDAIGRPELFAGDARRQVDFEMVVAGRNVGQANVKDGVVVVVHRRPATDGGMRHEAPARIGVVGNVSGEASPPHHLLDLAFGGVGLAIVRKNGIPVLRLGLALGNGLVVGGGKGVLTRDARRHRENGYGVVLVVPAAAVWIIVLLPIVVAAALVISIVRQIRKTLLLLPPPPATATSDHDYLSSC